MFSYNYITNALTSAGVITNRRMLTAYSVTSLEVSV